jgi:imidazole glycerol-phosphate synthase subunit HisF
MRIIPLLEIKNDYLIKGFQMEGVRNIGDPFVFAKKYYKMGADEIIIIDSVASYYNQKNLFSLIKNLTKEIFIPITIGGGIRNLKNIQNCLDIGADKVAINSAAIKRPQFLRQATREFGESTIISYIETKIIDQNYYAYFNNGRENSNIKLEDWIKKVQDMGCGEILIKSIDKDGTLTGLDFKLIEIINKFCKKPFIACGGLKDKIDLQKFISNYPHEGIAISSALHFDKIKINHE